MKRFLFAVMLTLFITSFSQAFEDVRSDTSFDIVKVDKTDCLFTIDVPSLTTDVVLSAPIPIVTTSESSIDVPSPTVATSTSNHRYKQLLANWQYKVKSNLLFRVRKSKRIRTV